MQKYIMYTGPQCLKFICHHHFVSLFSMFQGHVRRYVILTMFHELY